MNLAFPFRFPMAILLVDDDKEVIDATAQAFSYLLPGHFVYKMHSAKAAIRFLEEHALRFKSVPSEIDFSSFTPQGEAVFNAENLSNLDALKMHSASVGIAIIDYAMPEMSGVEFAKKIAEHSLSKILLTGQATITEALGAFNAGLIDRYVSKDESKAVQTLTTYVQELQQQRFNDLNGQFFYFLGDGHFSFLTKPDVQASLIDVCERINADRIAPYFSPPGLLVANKANDRFLIIVADDDTIASRIEIAKADGVGIDVIDAMYARTGLYLPDVENVEGVSPDDTMSYPHLYKMYGLTSNTYYVLFRLSST